MSYTLRQRKRAAKRLESSALQFKVKAKATEVATTYDFEQYTDGWRVVTTENKVYTVQDWGEKLICSCPDYTYRRMHKRMEECCHCVAVRALEGWSF
jgi:predicted nucleic acid-binding Zn finger protein